MEGFESTVRNALEWKKPFSKQFMAPTPLPTPIQKALYLNCFWILFPYLLHQVCPVEVRINYFQCLYMFEMPAKQKHLNAAVYPTIETVGRNPVRLVTSLCFDEEQGLRDICVTFESLFRLILHFFFSVIDYID